MGRTLCVGLTWFLLCAPCFAQTLGTITGEVRDSTGAVVPGATVTVTNRATNATRTTASNSVGLFDFPALPPGNYRVKSELDGFRTATRDVELQVQQTARVNFAFDEIILRSRLHRFHRHRFIVRIARRDDGQTWRFGFEQGNICQAGTIGQGHIEHHHVKMLAVDG